MINVRATHQAQILKRQANFTHPENSDRQFKLRAAEQSANSEANVTDRFASKRLGKTPDWQSSDPLLFSWLIDRIAVV
jgi:hypothetical protein